MLMMALRWLLCLVLLLFFYGKDIQREWPTIRKNLSWLAVMGGIFLAGFTVFFILAAQHTSAINLGIIQSSIPGIVVLFGVCFLEKKFGWIQICGLLISIMGVVYLVCSGSLINLISLKFNFGDILMFLACCCYASFAVGLTKKIPLNSFILLTVFSFFAFVTISAGATIEFFKGDTITPSYFGFFSIFYSGVIASLVGQVLFVRGVRAVGSNRAGLYINMVPVFGAAMAVIFLGEKLHSFHFISVLFVVFGIYLVEKYKTGE